jgi:hypothetical protein
MSSWYGYGDDGVMRLRPCATCGRYALCGPEAECSARCLDDASDREAVASTLARALEAP